MNAEKKLHALMQSISKAVQEKRFDDARVQCYHLLALCSEGRQALDVAKLLIQLDRNNADAYNLLGIAYASVDEWGEAGQAYARAFHINPNHGMAIMNYANLILKLGKIKQAVAYYEEALTKLDKKYHAAVYSNMANIYLDTQQLDKALELAKKAEKLDKNTVAVYSLLGNIYGAMGDEEKAENYYLRVVKIAPDRLAVLDNLACLYDRQGKTDKIVHYLAKSFAIRKKIYGNTAVQDWKLIKTGLLKTLYATYLQSDITDMAFRVVQSCNLDDVVSKDAGTVYKRIDDRNSVVKLEDVAIAPNGWHILSGGDKYSNLTFHVSKNAHVWPQADHLGRSVIRDFEKEETINKPVILMGGASNYYHWICDYLPRLEMIKASPELDGLPVVMNDDMADFQVKMLEMLGFDLSRIKPFKADTLYHVKQAYILHQNGRPLFNNNPDWMNPAVTKQDIDWLRGQFKPWMKSDSKMPKRLFLSREGAKFRRCVNEGEVFELAQQYGFEKVKNEDLSFEEQISLYAGAEAVMGVHGAGFTNMVFAPEGSTLIELHSKDELPPFYTHMTTLLGQNHYAIEGLVTQALIPLTPPFWDFEVDMAVVKQALDKLGKLG